VIRVVFDVDGGRAIDRLHQTIFASGGKPGAPGEFSADRKVAEQVVKQAGMGPE